MTQTMEREKLFTIAEVANRLRVNPMTVRRWIDKGLIEAIILPQLYGGYRHIRIKASTINALISGAPVGEAGDTNG